jgi:hypothetical protein
MFPARFAPGELTFPEAIGLAHAAEVAFWLESGRR